MSLSNVMFWSDRSKRSNWSYRSKRSNRSYKSDRSKRSDKSKRSNKSGKRIGRKALRPTSTGDSLQ